ncbi:MAG: ImmA/IrrE family metallo-endopeptidase [Bacilli bacterium]|nr:ImmA/IrrE family metallo-endopeptidase [Bacilli bacterium]
MKKVVHIKKEIFDWALGECNVPFDVVSSKKTYVSEIIEDKPITLRQAQDLSNFFKIPLGYFFLSEIPSNVSFKADFRTIGNKKNNSFSKDLKDVLLMMDYKKNWMSEYKRNNGFEQVQFNFNHNINDDKNDYAEELRFLLNLKINWFANLGDINSTFEFLKKRIESFGVLVMESGVVGQNTKRTLDINEFRGFVLNDEYAPLIFINTNDKTEARCFTLLHEFVHILANNEDDIDFGNQNVGIERKINAIVAEILMPEKLILNFKNKSINDETSIFKLANKFKVSVSAMALRLLDLRIISSDLCQFILDKVNNAIGNKKKSGGNFYNTFLLKTSSTFSYAVFESVSSNLITFNEAFSLLGIKGKTFMTYKEKLYATR